MTLLDFKLPDISSILQTPPVIPKIDLETTRIVNSIDNIQNINRLRDMDNFIYQIQLKEQQKNFYEKKLKSINASLDIKIGRLLSIIIIVISVLIPFLVIAFKSYFEPIKIIVFYYLLISFTFSMVSMCIYLFFFWKDKT